VGCRERVFDLYREGLDRTTIEEQLETGQQPGVEEEEPFGPTRVNVAGTSAHAEGAALDQGDQAMSPVYRGLKPGLWVVYAGGGHKRAMLASPEK
jgi:hypothetical protein